MAKLDESEWGKQEQRKTLKKAEMTETPRRGKSSEATNQQ
jgi:hypothetical protein